MNLISSGIATMYHEPGQPLYCDAGNGLLYSPTTQPWIALPVTWYQTGQVTCGDHMRLTFPDGQTLIGRALDAGNLHLYHIAEKPKLAIIADVPRHLWTQKGISAHVQLLNLTARARATEAKGLWP